MSSSTSHPYKLETKAEANNGGDSQRARACLTCRRSKHKCKPSDNPDKCLRCHKRGEECLYTVKVRKLEWQEWASEEIKTLTSRVQELEFNLADVRRMLSSAGFNNNNGSSSNGINGHHSSRLDRPPNSTTSVSFPYSPPDIPPMTAISANGSGPGPHSSTGSTTTHLPPIRTHSQTLSQAPPLAPQMMPAPMSISVPQPRPPPPSQQPAMRHSMSSMPSGSEDEMMGDDVGRFVGNGNGSSGNGNAMVGASNIDQVWSLTNNTQQVGLSPYMLSNSRAMDTGAILRDLADYTGGQAQSQLKGTVGSNDPRSNVVKKGLLSNESVEVLLNRFLSFSSIGLYGFILSATTFPFLPEGQSAMTPYILAVMLLVASERYPPFHYLAPLLSAEVTVANPTDLMGEGINEDEGEVDPELGIGPEEIMGAVIFATYSGEVGSAAVAKAAHKWAVWLYNMPDPEARMLTLGEMCGYLSPARPVQRKDGMRLVLLTYIVSIHQVVFHRSTPPPPINLAKCTELLSLGSQSSDQQRQADLLLVAHANLAYIMHRWRNLEIQKASSREGTPSLIEIDSINEALDDWYRTASVDESLLTMVWVYAKLIINTLGMINPDRVRAEVFQRRAMDSAARLIGIARTQVVNVVNQTPFYIEMIRVGCTMINLSLLRYQTWPTNSEDLNLIASMEDISSAMSSASLPPDHVTVTSGKELLNALNGLKRKWTG